MTHGLFAVHWSKSIQTWHIFSLPDGRPVPDLKLYCGTLNGNCSEPRLGSKYMYIIAMPEAQGGKALVLQYPLDSITREADPVLRYKPAATNDDIKRVFQHAGLDWTDDAQVWDLKLGNKTMHLNISDFCTYNHVQRPRVGTDADIEAWHKHVADVKIMAFEHKIQNTVDPSFDASRFRANPVLPPSETEQNCLKVELQKDGYSVQKPDDRICPTQAEPATAAEQQTESTDTEAHANSECSAECPADPISSIDNCGDVDNCLTWVDVEVAPFRYSASTECSLDVFRVKRDSVLLQYHVAVDDGGTNGHADSARVICWALDKLQEVITSMQIYPVKHIQALREDMVAKLVYLFEAYAGCARADKYELQFSDATYDVHK